VKLAADQVCPKGGVEDLDVDALLVHVAKPRGDIEPRLEASLEALHVACGGLGEFGARERVLVLRRE
jgi:hypothetical protein